LIGPLKCCRNFNTPNTNAQTQHLVLLSSNTPSCALQELLADCERILTTAATLTSSGHARRAPEAQSSADIN
jgi:hypothetical protein